MIIRVGLPKSTGELPCALFEAGLPGLISANSLWDPCRKEFRTPGSALIDGDFALDSAGFVVMQQWGGAYPWSVSQYVELAGLHSWTWWASMDYCCEPEIAWNEDEVLYRVHRTGDYLYLCREQVHRWRQKGAHWVQHPMPVLQGWHPDHYIKSVEITLKQLPEPPQMVGVGSVCRRPLRGPTGLEAVITRLDAELPAGIQLHLFGVKGSILQAMRDHPRVASMDSLAWDFHARKTAQQLRRIQGLELGYYPKPGDQNWIPCDNEHRIACMKAWAERQNEST
jgi:hypothetical protein